ncbi:hypothetical protein R1521_16875 [Rhizobium brockwellii]|jgi:hypothetical protein|uniref:Uncharacterized protein n=1 Tax=Rhizobium brockwellii TaxID=3019932 RepID=A0ABU3YMM8_9HYPH|nr:MULTISPECIES: hypothetical protein [Rhizobium]MDV4180176.1 hypothetical protein [Rhizobium brockwellii]MDV4187098.1 hypothetical protein [Rhizobium brockwellii]NZD48269.1 hypothetical protein [Rhizobium leguminosarum]QIO52986.1 hypothetical protein HA461_18225 [Rhizobium leguminosarum bv. trifolii]QND15260.1 hypothetical protein HB775_16275 [Rhizobium leguminosarum bv. trifolii]
MSLDDAAALAQVRHPIGIGHPLDPPRVQLFIESEISAATYCFRAAKRHGAEKSLSMFRYSRVLNLTREPYHGVDPA